MRKGVILVVVMGVLLIMVGLSLAAIYFQAQETRIVEHKFRRIVALFNAKAAMVYAYFELVQGNNPTQNNLHLPGLQYPVDINVSAPDANGMRQVTVTVFY